MNDFRTDYTPHSYKKNFDTLGERIDQQTGDTYATALIESMLIAFVLAIPFILFFWSL